jgi:hypothetical protein
MSPQRPAVPILSNHTADAREAMAALINARSLAIREDEPSYPAELARIAWAIADEMSAQRMRRQGGRR